MSGLKVDNLTAGYGKREVLKDVSLEAPEGKMVFLLGPNGAGKSTLLKCVAGIIKPKSGRILLGDRDLREVSFKEISKLVGYVPQSMRPAFSTSVFEAVLTSRLPHFNWGPSKTDLEKTEEVLNVLGLEQLAFRSVNELSGGEWQKVLLAMALVKEPALLLLDEPTSNLDLKHQVEVMKILSKLVKGNGLSALITTHDINLASKYADVVTLMKGGQIYAVGKPNHVLSEEVIQEVYGVKVEVIRSASLFISPL
jgi:iron complex transport system ATP-binding protein